jgi:hypothetical protein
MFSPHVHNCPCCEDRLLLGCRVVSASEQFSGGSRFDRTGHTIFYSRRSTKRKWAHGGKTGRVGKSLGEIGEEIIRESQLLVVVR